MRNATFLILLVAIFAFSSCKSNLDETKISSTPDEKSMDQANGFTEALVSLKYVEQGCNVVLVMTIDNIETLYRPLSLEDDYKVDGLKVKVNYTLSRAPQGDCLIANPVVINKIEKF